MSQAGKDKTNSHRPLKETHANTAGIVTNWETLRRMAKCIPTATKYITSQLSVSQGPRRRVFVNFKQDMQSTATLKAITMT